MSGLSFITKGFLSKRTADTTSVEINEYKIPMNIKMKDLNNLKTNLEIKKINLHK